MNSPYESPARTVAPLRRGGHALFFPAAALCGVLVLLAGMAQRAGMPVPAGLHGPGTWHAHEMLFGFGGAVLAGFLLTAVPNWTGGLPLTGRPLALVFALWLAGRIAFLAAEGIGAPLAAAIDLSFLPAVVAITALPVVRARKWRDFKVIGPVAALAAANAGFHLSAGEAGWPLRLALSVYVLLVTVVGGRLLPSETRNALRRTGRTDLPAPHGSFDTLCLLCGGAALALWTAVPQGAPAATSGAAAALLHALRLARWRGWAMRPAALLAMLHLSYGFVPLGFAATALAALGLLPAAAALHVFAIGLLGGMMFAVMLRMRLKQAGRALMASPGMVVAWLAVVMAAPFRLAADLGAARPEPALFAATLLWSAAFVFFTFTR